MASIDVAIPCYEYGRFLPDYVASLTNQGVERLRMLIIDNASTDDSLEIARRLAAADRRIEILARSRNPGPHASFNAGIDWVSADHFMVLCADDLMAPGMLRRAAAALYRHPDAILTCGAEVSWEQGRERLVLPLCDEAEWWIQPGEQFLEERCRGPMGPVCTGMVLVRTAAQKRAGHYRSTLLYYDDHEILLRLATLGPVARTTTVQGIRRLHADTMSNNHNKTKLEDLRHRRDVFESFFTHEGARCADRTRLETLADSRFAAQACRWVLRALARGRLGAATGQLRFMRDIIPSGGCCRHWTTCCTSMSASAWGGPRAPWPGCKRWSAVRIRRAFLLALADRYATLIVGLPLIAAMSRLLSPRAIGISILGTLLLALVEIIRDVPTGYLIHCAAITVNDVRVAFTAMLIVTGLTCVVPLLGAGPIAALLGDADLVPYLHVLALVVLTGSIKRPLTALMRRTMQFGRLAIINVTLFTVNTVVCVGLALLAANCTACLLVLCFGFDGGIYRPRLRGWRTPLRFSGASSLWGGLLRLTDSLPSLMLGVGSDLGAVGLYGRTQAVCDSPAKLILASI